MGKAGTVIAMGAAADGGEVLGSAGIRGARPGTVLATKKMRGREADAGLSLEPHVCRHCFGRLLSAPQGDARRYVCSNCGASASGASPAVLCACGMTLKGKGPTGALLACGPNPNPTPEFPSLFVAAAA